jgi:hypothetical protein
MLRRDDRSEGARLRPALDRGQLGRRHDLGRGVGKGWLGLFDVLARYVVPLVLIEPDDVTASAYLCLEVGFGDQRHELGTRRTCPGAEYGEAGVAPQVFDELIVGEMT